MSGTPYASALTRRGAGLLVAALTSSAGCARGDGEVPPVECDLVDRPVSDAEVLPDGKTVEELLEHFASTRRTATWIDGTTAELDVEITRASGTATLWEMTDLHGDPHEACAWSYVHFPVVATLKTDDERLDLAVEARGQTKVFEEVPYDGYWLSISGTLGPAQLDALDFLPEMLDAVGIDRDWPDSAVLEGWFVEGGDPALLGSSPPAEGRTGALDLWGPYRSDAGRRHVTSPAEESRETLLTWE